MAHYGRIHRGNRLNWISELRGEDVDHLEPSAVEPDGRCTVANQRATNLGTAQDLADRLLGDHDCERDACGDWIELPDGAKPIRPTSHVTRGQLVRLTADGHCIPLGAGWHALSPGEIIYVAQTAVQAGSTGWVEPRYDR